MLGFPLYKVSFQGFLEDSDRHNAPEHDKLLEVRKLLRNPKAKAKSRNGGLGFRVQGQGFRG